MAINRIVVLILLSFALTIAISILGGAVAAFIQTLNHELIGLWALSPLLGGFMFDYGHPLILVEIVSRIPQNIIDRLITAFAGYGIALAVVNVKWHMRSE